MSKKVAVLVTDLFEDSEFTEPVKALEEAGHEITTIDVEGGKTVKGKKEGTPVKIDKGIDEVDPTDFDALLIPGGYSPDKLRKDERILDFVRYFSKEELPIFTICHGPQLLINAEVLKGKKITSVSQVAIDLKNAGALWEDSELVIDDSGLISSRTPEDLPVFDQAIVEALK
ncbi:type 1 glutamine amidotransferase domain-containing protein [Bavariicoccus seileri]|uniref:type 1 glutamine amidotransferase domain-containing protein n=1 Tax=Bavariicoccus seileri TaxID=549685 RepID=UPI0003B47063|nr:type 1 glutamine amidotransferase domain-containing protein [Bavariicoccus seileri]